MDELPEISKVGLVILFVVKYGFQSTW